MNRKSFDHMLAAAALALRHACRWRCGAGADRDLVLLPGRRRRRRSRKLIDDFAADFGKENPGIKVTPIYAGSYQDTIVKALTAHKAGTPPVTSVLLSTDMFTLIDEDAIVPFDDFAKTADDKAWLGGFYKAFMLNSQTGGKTWGIPFQRSTVVLYWNKELFKDAGLDPNKPPATWAEMADYAKKLTVKDASGNVTQWGVQIPSSGFPYWLFQALTTQNGVVLANDTGNAVKFDDPTVIEALQYWVDLAKAGVHPPGIVEWGTTPKDFFEKKAAMMWTTTGNLTNVRNNAKFEFGVAMLPARQAPRLAHRRRQLLHLQEGHAGAAGSGVQVRQVDHAARARRAVEHGHRLRRPCPRPPTTPTRCTSTARDFPPALVARDQLPLCGGRVLDARQPARDQGAQRRPAGRADRHQDAGAGDEGRAGARPTASCAPTSEAQACSAGIGRHRAGAHRPRRHRSPQRRRRRRHAWLLLLPALRAAGRVHALPGGRRRWSTASSPRREARPSGVWVGLENYRVMVERPDVLEGAAQQPLVRAAPPSRVDRPGAGDGAVGQRAHRRARLPAHGLLHAHRAADDRGGQHLAVLLHAAVRPARADHRLLWACPRTTGSATRAPRSARSRWWRSGRRPASS